jgi:hypothetical protein
MGRILYTGLKKSNKVAGPPTPLYKESSHEIFRGTYYFNMSIFQKIFPIPDSFLLIAKQVMAIYIMIVILIEVYIGSIMSHSYPNTAMQEVEYLNSP